MKFILTEFIVFIFLVCLNVNSSANDDFSRGVAEFNKGRYEIAVSLFERALAKQPAKAIIHYNLGLAYFKFEKYTAAKIALETSWQLDNRLAPFARFYLGLCYYQENEPEKARAELNWVIVNCQETNLGLAAKKIVQLL